MKPTFVFSKYQGQDCKGHYRYIYVASKIKKPSLPKHINCSLAEQHSKLYLQSKSEATATKQIVQQLQSNQGPQSSISDGYKAVLYIATRQSSPQL